MKFRIRDEMDKQHITVKSLSEKTGLSERTIEEFIKRDSGNITIYSKIAKALDVPFDSLIIWDDESVDESSEKTISDLSEIDTHNSYDEAGKHFSNKNEKLSKSLFKKRDEIRFKATIKEAEDSGAAGDYKNMIDKYSTAFLTLNVSDICTIPLSAITRLVSLCKEHSSPYVLDSLIDRVTSKRFMDKKYASDVQKFHAEFIKNLTKYDFAQQVEYLMDTIS